jgi:hypothetical protein
MIETTKEMIAIMQAYCDGEIIEFSPYNSNSWKEIDNPFWDWKSMDYRVKPKTKYIPFNNCSRKGIFLSIKLQPIIATLL